MNRARRLIWLIAALLGGVLACAAFILAAQSFAIAPALARWLGMFGLAALGLIILAFWVLDRLFGQGQARLANALDLALVATPPRRARLAALPVWFEPVVSAAARLLDRLDQTEDRLLAERQQAERALEGERRRLAAILRDLAEGLVCCSLDGRILLYNEAAHALLGGSMSFGLGRSLFDLIHRPTLLHHLGLVRRETARDPATLPVSEPFLATTARGDRLLRCRLSLVLSAESVPESFVLVFAAVGEEVLRLRGDAFLERLAHAWRSPLASLRAAAELVRERLGADPDGEAFLRIVLDENARLERVLQELAEEGRRFVLSRSELFDVEAGDLVEILRDRLRERRLALELRAPAAPLWFAADSFALTELLSAFLEQLAAWGVSQVEVDGRMEEQRVVLELAWVGPVPSSRSFAEWLDRPLLASLALTARDLAARHGSTPWVAPRLDRKGGFLRLELPPPRGLHRVERRLLVAARPEFYDFAIAEPPPANLAETPLSQLAYVVFDTETTGLDPAREELVQLAAVRVVNGRILRSETFDALINPGRPIPPQATRIHGITDEMVAGRPPPPLIIARFAEFARGSVLVAHNAAFDLTFLRRWENEAGVRFDQPLLDTLLLSAVVHEDIEDHSLDGIAERLGILIRARHSALGDALATAEVFVRLIELLRLRGIVTLGEALAASRRVALRRQRLAAAGAKGSTP